MPGPGFPPPPRGGFGGPPPRGGFGGPRGPMFGPEAHYFYRPVRPPIGGNTPNPGEPLSHTIAGYSSDVGHTFKYAIHRKGIAGGIFLGIRKLTSGQLRYESFAGKVATYDKQLALGRITELQCKKRKLQAAKKYHGYLLKTGYYDMNEYEYRMSEYARTLGLNYVNDRREDMGRSR